MSFVELPGSDRSVLVTADHASARVPAGIALGVPPKALATHIAVDIGIDPLARALAAALDAPALLGGVSRLVVDLNREEDHPGLFPRESDGVQVPGNALNEVCRVDRLRLYYHPYHDRLAALVAAHRPRLILSLHSFTPMLRAATEPRPWEVGVLYNAEDRAARVALPLLAAQGIVTGDNLPYSGRVLNATMNRHGERTGTPYLGLEVRQDLIGEAAGVARWAARLLPVIRAVREALA